MDIEKLIKRLNNHLQSLVAYSDPELAHTLEDAATALSTLHGENEKLRAELEQVKQERDAAIDCCSGYCATCRFEKDCAKHDMNDAAPTRWYYGDCEDWEWCSSQKED